MTDRPIIFSGPMVRALLEGRKTQTRRALPKAHPRCPWHCVLDPDGLIDPLEVWYWDGVHDRVGASYRLPYAPGDRLWVREAIAWDCDGVGCAYLADGEIRGGTSPLFMPRRVSRLTLTITDVRVQRVQEIAAKDAEAEGIYRVDPTAEDEAWYRAWCEERGVEPDLPMASVWMAPGTRQGWGLTREDRDREQWGPTPQFAFRCAWNSLNAKRGLGWDANPWVAALTFEVHRCNIDKLGVGDGAG